MIIDKLVYTNLEKQKIEKIIELYQTLIAEANQVGNAEQALQYFDEEITQRQDIKKQAERRYILSFCNNKAAVLEDVKEILTAVTKEEFETRQDRIRKAIPRHDIIEETLPQVYNFDSEKSKDEAIRILKSANDSAIMLSQKTYNTAMSFLYEILSLQVQVTFYHFEEPYDQKEQEEVQKIFVQLLERKAAEWYEPPTPPDSKNNKEEADSGKLEELPIIQRVKKPESVCYALFKPTYTLFNNFPIGQTKKLNAASEADRRKGKTANILLLLNFDELEGVKISRTLTIYDKSVWNACANLARCGYEIVTAQDVYRFMGYNNNLNQRDKKKILESIETIIRARVFINNKEEHALYKKYDEISLNTPLLAAEICKAKIGNTVVEEAIRIIEPPKLFAIAEKRGQITTIPFAVLESPINKNDDIALITDYLLIRISRMKNSKQIHRTILLDTLYDKCNITDSASDRMKKSRLPDKINRLLNHYKSVGWIGGYKLTTKEIVIIPEKPEEE